MFESMVELFNEGKPVDLVTLQNRLREKDVPPEVSSLDFVRDIITIVPTSANVKSYAAIVSEKAVLRRLIKTTEEIANTCYAGKESLEAVLEKTEKAVFDLLQKRNTGEYVPIKQVVLNALDRIEKASKNKGTVTGILPGSSTWTTSSRAAALRSGSGGSQAVYGKRPRLSLTSPMYMAL